MTGMPGSSGINGAPLHLMQIKTHAYTGPARELDAPAHEARLQMRGTAQRHGTAPQ
jgi:hypothetical protein